MKWEDSPPTPTFNAKRPGYWILSTLAALAAGIYLLVICASIFRRTKNGDFLYINEFLYSQPLSAMLAMLGTALLCGAFLMCVFLSTKRLTPFWRKCTLAGAISAVLIALTSAVVAAVVMLVDSPDQLRLLKSDTGTQALLVNDTDLFHNELQIMSTQDGHWFSPVAAIGSRPPNLNSDLLHIDFTGNVLLLEFKPVLAYDQTLYSESIVIPQ